MDMERIKITNNYTTFFRYLEKREYNGQYISFDKVSRKPVIRLGRKFLHNVLMDPYFSLPGNLFTLMKIYLTLRRLISYIYGAPILDVSRSHTTTHHGR